MKDTSVIPKGMYCYDENGMCPYWSIRKDLPPQQNGYCSYLEESDYDRNTDINEEPVFDLNSGKKFYLPERFPSSLLWDRCKECGINDWGDDEL